MPHRHGVQVRARRHSWPADTTRFGRFSTSTGFRLSVRKRHSRRGTVRRRNNGRKASGTWRRSDMRSVTSHAGLAACMVLVSVIGVKTVRSTEVVGATASKATPGSGARNDCDEGSPVEGRRIFVRENCYSCHGGFAGGAMCPSLREDRPDESDVRHAVEEGDGKRHAAVSTFARTGHRESVLVFSVAADATRADVPAPVGARPYFSNDGLRLSEGELQRELEIALRIGIEERRRVDPARRWCCCCRARRLRSRGCRDSRG